MFKKGVYFLDKNYALINCNIFDGNLNSDIQNDIVILVKITLKEGSQKGIIYKIGKRNEIAIPSDYEIIDLKQKYVIPGLINAHLHLYGSGIPNKTLQSKKGLKFLGYFLKTSIGKTMFKRIERKRAMLQLKSGVTTIRCMGEIPFNDVEFRNEINKNKYMGPRILASGIKLGATGGHAFLCLTCDSPEEARKNVRKNASQGVDWIKIGITGGVMDARKLGELGRMEMKLEEVSAICDEAHKLGLMVAAHVQSKEGTRVALLGGVDTIEHGCEMDDDIINLYKNNPMALRGFSSLVTTLHAVIPLAKIDEDVTGVTELAKKNSSLLLDSMFQGIKQAIDNNINLGLGTDATAPFVTHYNSWRELEYLVRYTKVTPKQAIYYATKSNAKVLGIDDETGSIEIGKAADILVLDENPLENLRTLSKPNMVICRGHIIMKPNVKKAEYIDNILDEKTL